MATVIIKPNTLRGRVVIPPSKSIAHRAILAAALCRRECAIQNIEMSGDIEATLGCIAALGGTFRYEKESLTLTVDGVNFLSVADDVILDCGESGSTLRFLMPISLLSGRAVAFTGRGKLMERPQTPYFTIFDEKGIGYSQKNDRIVLRGNLAPGRYALPGNVSSQFVTGLLFALANLKGDSSIEMTTLLESRPYVDLTIDVLRQFHVQIANENYQRFSIQGGQEFVPCRFTVEGDYSQAAFWMVANAMGNQVVCEGLRLDSLQGDRRIADIIASPSDTIDVRDTPDLVPILAVLCCFRKGQSRLVGAGRLRIKESDRLWAITTELNKLGAKITALEDSLMIEGVDRLHTGEVDSWNDHRIAMALAIASTRCDGAVTIGGAESVNKSYPSFWKDFENCGGELTYIG